MILKKGSLSYEIKNLADLEKFFRDEGKALPHHKMEALKSGQLVTHKKSVYKLEK